MRAILIDPEKRIINEIQLEDADYRKIQATLRCRSFTTGAHQSGSIEQGFDAIYVSDDELPEEPTTENPGPSAGALITCRPCPAAAILGRKRCRKRR